MAKHETAILALLGASLVLIGSAPITRSSAAEQWLTWFSRIHDATTRPPLRATAASTAYSTPASGANAIREALAIVAKTTTVPLEAPYPSTIRAPGFKGYLSASTMATTNRYAVILTETDKAYPVNDPAIQRTTGLAQQIGIFSGQRYRSAVAAQAALYTGNYQPPPASRPRHIRLLPAVTADEWRQRNATIPMGIMEWHQHGWTVQINQLLDSSLARTLARRLAHTRLPANHGVIAVENAGDGAHTIVCWRSGRVDYQTFSESLPQTAIDMAASMHLIAKQRLAP
ncbi:MAG: hypothetical protein OWU84_05700 [Firmicutes bacterium]|nr:hypothetical protein [Bacillota bacterium]